MSGNKRKSIMFILVLIVLLTVQYPCVMAGTAYKAGEINIESNAINDNTKISDEAQKENDVIPYDNSIAIGNPANIEVGRGIANDFSYTVNSDGATATIWGYARTPEGSLNIPEFVDGYTVTAIGGSAFYYNTGFTGSLTIPDTVTSIGDAAFYECSGFTGDLSIPDSVTSIGPSAFYNCKGFNGKLTISKSVTEICEQTFLGCAGLKGNLSIPDGVTSIGKHTFHWCSGFKGTLSIPSSVTNIGAAAFAGCSGLSGNLKIPDNIIELQNGVFSGCKGFTGGLIIPNNVTRIGDDSFSYCQGFTGTLTIPRSVSYIGADAFCGCIGFTGSLIIPDNVPNIDQRTFWHCDNIKRIVNNSDATIDLSLLGGDYFEHCDNWKWYSEGTNKEITSLSNGVAIREDYDAFEDLDDLRSVTLCFGPNNVSFDFMWSPGKLLKSKESMDKDLAQICLILSNKVYNDKGRENLDEALIELDLVDDDKEVLSANLDKTDNRWHMNYTNDISPAYSLALKTYPFNGNKYNLVTIVIRGTNEKKDLDRDFSENGFITAAQDVYDELDKFLDGHGIKITDSNNRFLITGHSLGGAVANLTQYYIIQNSYNTYMSSDSDEEIPLNNGMTCYTYESPFTLWASDRVFSQFGRSINYLKPGDPIPLWSNNYSVYLKNAKTYAASNDAIGRIAQLLQLYKPKYYSAMRFGRDISLGKNTETVLERYKEYTGRDYNTSSGDPAKDLFDRYHQCEICMALIKEGIDDGTFDDVNKEIMQQRRILSAYCPVDIDVINPSSNNTVASIKNNEVVVLDDENIQMGTVGDIKFVNIPADTNYYVRITGSDEGTMDFIIQDVCQDDKGIYLSNTSRFDNVVLAKGKVMESPIETTVSTSNLKLFVLDGNGKAVKTISEDGTETDYLPKAQDGDKSSDNEDSKSNNGETGTSTTADTGLKPIETQYKSIVNVKDILLPYYTKLHPDVVVKKTKFKSSDKKTVKVNKKGIAKGGKNSGSATITMFVKTEETFTKPNGKQKKKLSKWTSACTLDVNNTGKQGK